MADSEKGDSSIKEAKAKTSMLDDDFSKDFLSSWKSMSATGGDDMDFDFEPVSKGKKNKFDFGMDMEFSLDDAFGKISSFKIDMPDFDFSSYPKKPTKPKEKTVEASGNGNHQEKNDKFFFSFDFDGEPTAENSTVKKNKFPGDIISKFPVAQANIDSGRTELSASVDKGEGSTPIVAADKSCSYGSSKHNERNSDDYPSSCTKELMKLSVLGEREKIAAAHIDAASNSGHDEKKSDDSASSCTKELSKADSVMEKSEKIAAAGTSPRGRDDTEYEENRNEMSADTVPLPNHGKETKNGLPSLKNEKIITNVKSASGPTTATRNKVMEAMNSKFPVAQATTDNGRPELSASEGNREGLTHIDAVDKSCSKYGSGKHNENNSDEDYPSLSTKEFSKPDSVLEKSEKIAAALIDDVDRSYGSNRHKEKDSDEFAISCTKELTQPDSVLEEREKIAAAAGIDGVDRSSYGDSRRTENKSDDSTSSCTKELSKPDSVFEKSEKIAAAHTPPRDHRDAVYGKQRNEMSVDTAQHSIKEAKNGLPSLEHTKRINNVKSSGFKIPSVSPPEQRSNFGNQVQGKLNNKISGIGLIPKLKNGLPSLKNEKIITNVKSASCSKYGSGKHNENNSDENYPSLSTKELSKPDSVPEESEKIAAARIDNVDRSYGSNRHKEKDSDEFTRSCTKALTQPDSVLEEREKIAAAGIDGVDRSYGDSRRTENKSDDSTSSCTKELIKPDSFLEKSEKIAAAHTPPREMSVDTAQHSVKEANNGLPSLEYKKMINNVKSSGFKIPSVSPPEQGCKFGYQVQGKLNKKISGSGLIPKLNIGHENKLSSQSNDKKKLALPSLNVTRGATKDKHPAVQRNAKSPGNVERSIRLQATIKMVPPVSAEKQTPSNPSLKRKPSEVADMVPAKLHTPKCISTSESRMSNILVREVEEGAQTQGIFNRKNESVEYPSPKFDFSQEATRETLQFSMVVENDENVEKAEACAKELDNICNMLKKKHEETKELLVRVLVNNNNLLMLNHPIYEEKIRAVQRLASRLMSKELEVEA